MYVGCYYNKMDLHKHDNVPTYWKEDYWSQKISIIIDRNNAIFFFLLDEGIPIKTNIFINQKSFQWKNKNFFRLSFIILCVTNIRFIFL